MPTYIAYFRFYEELNDFLPPAKRKQTFPYSFKNSPAIKDAIEALGVPHTEVDLILVNGEPAGFDYRLRHNDRIAVYPVFESLDISTASKLREKPLRYPTFILDVHLGKLAKMLRMLGFDTLYRNDYDDPEIVYIALKEKRIILTRDKGLLKVKTLSHGYFVRSEKPAEQLQEVLKRFDLLALVKPFHRCMICNGVIEKVEKEKIADRLLPKTKKYYDEFYRCCDCEKIYWQGSHFERMNHFVKKLNSPQAGITDVSK